MKRTVWIRTAVGGTIAFLLAGFCIRFALRTPSVPVRHTSSGRIAAVEPSHRGTPARRTFVHSPRPTVLAPSLSPEMWNRLASGFTPADTRPDSTLPRTRQVLLRNRRLVVPEKRTFPDRLEGVRTPRGAVPCVVMFSETVEASWADGLEGVYVRGPLPRNAWLAELTDAGLRRVAAFPAAQGVSVWEAADKLDALLAHVAAQTRESVRVSVQTFAPEDAKRAASGIEAVGGRVESVSANRLWGLVKAVVPAGSLDSLAMRGEIQWIESAPLPRLGNNLAVETNLLNAATVWRVPGLTGRGQLIGHADSGIDTGDFATIHPDFTNTVAYMSSRTGSIPYDAIGHGTHTAGSIVGDGSASEGKYRGAAWQAQLFHQCVVDSFGYFSSFTLDEIFSETYESGARIHSDSWGEGETGTFGQYNPDCADNDLFTWDHPDFLTVFAAGNEGADADKDGVVDMESLNMPSSAKNTISVGAAENGRKNGGYSNSAWKIYSFWADPIANDYIGYSENGALGMAAFSSRGPAADGRVKPDVVAPGAVIISCRSSRATHDQRVNSNERYAYNQGTSMATPLVAGSAALVRQYLMELTEHTEPSAALIKAMLLGGAHSIGPGQYGTGATREIPEAVPNSVEGWGMVNVGETIAPTNLAIRLFDRLSPRQGETLPVAELVIVEEGKPLDILLNWTDYPATAGTSATLVNDLDLVVTAPDGTRLYPNGGDAPDEVNTVESVRLASAPVGTYTVSVAGTYVVETGGVAAVYVRGAFADDGQRTFTTVYRDASSDTVLMRSSEGFTAGETVEISAPAVLEAFAFYGWYVDDERYPDATSASPLQLAWPSLTSNLTVEARYLPLAQDSDGDLFSDWWEMRFFGTLESVSAEHFGGTDTDGDGWTDGLESLDGTDPTDSGSVPSPPSIHVVPLAVRQTEHPPWTVYATVTDNFRVDRCWLAYREEGESDWTSIPMIPQGDGRYAAELDPPSKGAKTVEYNVGASDRLVTLDFVEYGVFYRVVGDYSEGWFSLSPETLPLLEVTEESTNIQFTAANLAGADVVWTTRISRVCTPLSNTDEAWFHGGQNDAWTLTTNRMWNGQAVWYLGNPASRKYASETDAVLNAPAFTVGRRGGFFFRHWIQTEPDVDDYFWDGGVVRLSVDGGETFFDIAPVGGYPGLIVTNEDSFLPPDTPCFGTTGGEWQTVFFDLSAYEGRTVIVQFDFCSDLYVVDEGWYVTDVTPFAFEGEPPAWLSAETPTSGTLAALCSATNVFAVDATRLARNEEESVLFNVSTNGDANLQEFRLLSVRRGARLTARAEGPGTVAPGTAFLFRDVGATVVATPGEGAYVNHVLRNGEEIPLPAGDGNGTFAFPVDGWSGGDIVFDIRFAEGDVWSLTVESEFGKPTPAKGRYQVGDGVTVEATANSPYLSAITNIRYACIGWTLEGDGYGVTGVTDTAIFALTNHATLTWFWIPEYRLSMNVLGSGRVVPESGWYRRGTNAVFTAFPEPYFHLDGWTADRIYYADMEENGETLTLDNVQSYGGHTARFVANRTATHNVPEWWLARYGFADDFEAASEDDADGDGMKTWQEWRADTDPTNALSCLRFLQFATDGGTTATLRWTGGVEATQRLEYANSLTNGNWIPFATNLPPCTLTNRLDVPLSGPARFYRVTVPER